MSSAAGTLTWSPLAARLDLVAEPVAAAAGLLPAAMVAPIDPELADTAAFCAAYDVAVEHSANCVVVAGRRGGTTRYAAVLVLASTRADINGVVRRELDARKCSFAPQDDAVRLTGMQFGGITALGLPPSWPVLVDEAVLQASQVVVGSGLRRSKLLVPAMGLLDLPLTRALALAT